MKLCILVKSRGQHWVLETSTLLLLCFCFETRSLSSHQPEACRFGWFNSGSWGSTCLYLPSTGITNLSYHTCFFFCFFVLFWDKILLCSLGWPGTLYVDQSDLELMDHAHATMSRYTPSFVTWILGMKIRSSACVAATLPTEVLPAPSSTTPEASMSDWGQWVI